MFLWTATWNTAGGLWPLSFSPWVWHQRKCAAVWGEYSQLDLSFESVVPVAANVASSRDEVTAVTPAIFYLFIYFCQFCSLQPQLPLKQMSGAVAPKPLEHCNGSSAVTLQTDVSWALCGILKAVLVGLTLPRRGIRSLWPGGGRGSGSRDRCFRRRWPWRRSLCRSWGEARSSTTAWWQTPGSSALLRGELRPWRSYSQWPRSHPSSAAPGGRKNTVLTYASLVCQHKPQDFQWRPMKNVVRRNASCKMEAVCTCLKPALFLMASRGRVHRFQKDLTVSKSRP